jgi:hypothetical protein
MPEARETWTDERLDDLSRRVDNGFARVDARSNQLETRMDARFNHLETRIDSLQRTIIQFGATTTAGILATLVTIVLTRA